MQEGQQSLKPKENLKAVGRISMEPKPKTRVVHIMKAVRTALTNRKSVTQNLLMVA